MKRDAMRTSKSQGGGEADLEGLNFDDLDNYYDEKMAKLELLCSRGRILLSQIDEIFYGMREFIEFVSSFSSIIYFPLSLMFVNC